MSKFVSAIVKISLLLSFRFPREWKAPYAYELSISQLVSFFASVVLERLTLCV